MDAIAQSPFSARSTTAFVYRGARRQHVAFPLGGIGSGSVSLTGGGRLDRLEHPQPARHPPAQRLQPLRHQGRARRRADRRPGAQRPLRRIWRLDRRAGASSTDSASARIATRWPACRISTTRSSSDDFPVAEIEFIRDGFPGKVRMTAFSPFIPAQRPRQFDAGGHVLDRSRERRRHSDRLYDRRRRSATTAATAACTSSRDRGRSARCTSPPPTSSGRNGSAAISR